MPPDTKDLLIKPDASKAVSGETLVVTPASIGFQYLTLKIRELSLGESFDSETGASELA